MSRLVFILRAILIVLLLLTADNLLFAELETIIDLKGLASVTRESDGDALFAGVQMSKLNFQSTGNEDVKGELEVVALFADQLFSCDMTRAYIKARFPGFRVTAGKTRVSWGEGFLFNAGDVIFGSLSPVSDLATPELREETAWLLDLYIPLGQFSYLEGTFLPYPTGRTGNSLLVSSRDLRGGGRVVTKLAGIKLEAGYLYRADETSHNPYVSFEGNLFFDMNLSATVSVPADAPVERSLKDSFALTYGLMRIFHFENQSTLTVRMESAIFPFGLWKKSAVPGPDTRYGLLLYPELAWAPMDVLSVSLRSILNPVARSGLVTAGVNFNIYQGLTLLGYAWLMFGDGADYNFRFGRAGDAGLSLGMEYIF